MLGMLGNKVRERQSPGSPGPYGAMSKIIKDTQTSYGLP